MLIYSRENWKFELDKNRKDGVKIVLQTSNRILTEEEKYEKVKRQIFHLFSNYFMII